jgi:hypothetical protein
MRQHRLEIIGGRKDIDVFDLLIAFLVGFPSCNGERSGVFAEDENFFRHERVLP